MFRIVIAWCLTLALGLSVFAAPPDFDRTIAPILTACLDCHTGAESKGHLDLSRKKSALAAIEPGKPEKSAIWSRVHADEMPPKKPLSANDKAALKAWIEAGAIWGTDPIDPLGYSNSARAGRDWWSLQPVKSSNTSGVDSIDRFIQLKLKAEGLQLSPEADRRILIRRLKFDLLGLPATPEEVQAFLADKSADAYSKLVEKYLATPQYGERWARHWLDTVRFAESNGFETNTLRPNAWPYRDWVIKSFNDDKPYDRFVFEQLAGDTIGADAATGFLVAGAWDAVKSPDVVLTSNQRADELHDIVSTVGSTFLGLTVGCARCHTHKFDPIPQLDYYRIKAVFAGVQHGERDLRTVNDKGRAQQLDVVRKSLATLENHLEGLEPLADPTKKTPVRLPVNSRRNLERFAAVRAKFVRFEVFATNSAEPCVDELEIFSVGANPKNVARGATVSSSGDYPGSPDIHRLEFVNDGNYGNSRSWISNSAGKGWVILELPESVEIDRMIWGRDREEKYRDRLATNYNLDVSLDGKTWRTVASSKDRAASESKLEAPPSLAPAERENWQKWSKLLTETRTELAGLQRFNLAYLGRFVSPETTHRLHRGDPMEKREVIAPGTLTGIGPKLVISSTADDASRRAALANWIVDPANPLTPRVLVNRIWQLHFGGGLVTTPSDFGYNGGRPSHPELLDWLASEFVAKKWSTKHLHRLILNSKTYRQSSTATVDGVAKDAGNRWLWRYTPRRLEAEAIRDSILAVSGKLDMTPGGPGFDLFDPNSNYVKVYTPKKTFGPAEFRRMIYQQKPRMQLDDTFGVFDCPDGGQAAPKRNSSTTPLQALNLLNSPFLLQQAGYFADRVEKETDQTPASNVRRAFQLAFQREPSDKESIAAIKLVTDHGLAALCRALLNANEFLYVD